MDNQGKQQLGQGIGYSVSAILGAVTGMYGGQRAGSAISDLGMRATDAGIEASGVSPGLPGSQRNTEDAKPIGEVYELQSSGFTFTYYGNKQPPDGCQIRTTYGAKAKVQGSKYAVILSGKFVPGEKLYVDN